MSFFASATMENSVANFESECRHLLYRFFAAFPDAAMQQHCGKVLRLLRASEKPLKGKAEGWAAGIIYFVATDGHFPCGVPGVSNAEFSEFMGVPMETSRRRSGRVRDIVLL